MKLLKFVRAEKKVSTEQLAKDLGIFSRGKYIRFENGYGVLSQNERMAVAEYLGIQHSILDSHVEFNGEEISLVDKERFARRSIQSEKAHVINSASTR